MRERVVLGFKLSKLGSVSRLHIAKTRAPLKEGWLAKATGPTKFLDGHARVSLFEEADDLLIGKSGLFHSCSFQKLAGFVPSLWYGREGAGQIIKSVTARQNSKCCPQVRKKLSGGEFWTDGYFASTLEKHVDQGKIGKYVKNQDNEYQ